MDNNKKICPPRLPGQLPKIDDSKIQDKKIYAPMSEELSKYPSSSVVRQQGVKRDNPVLVLAFKHKKLVISLIAIFASLLIATGIIFLVLPKPTRPADVWIKFDVSSEYELIRLDSSVSPGVVQKVMPGDTFNSKFTVSNTDELENNGEVYVRIRLYSVIKENGIDNIYYDIFDFNLEGNNNWCQGGDGYLYYLGTLKSNTTIEICNKIRLNKELGNEFQGKEIKVVFEGQCLQAGLNTYGAIIEEWPTAPHQFRDRFDDRGSQV